MLDFNAILAGHPLTQTVTLKRDARADDITANAILRMGADLIIDEAAGIVASHSASFLRNVDVAQEDEIIIAGVIYIALNEPLDKPDEGRKLVGLELKDID